MNRIATSYSIKIAASLEFFVAAILLVAILSRVILLVMSLIGDLIRNPQAVDLNRVLGDALVPVVRIELIKMLVKHVPGAAVEVLLFAMAREMMVTHAGSIETLMGVIAVGTIFPICHYCCSAKATGTERGKEA